MFSEIGTQAGLLEGYALFTIRTKDEFERALGAAPTGRVARFPWLGSGFAFVRAEVEDAQALVLIETGAEDISLHRDFARPAAEVWSFSGLAHPVSGLRFLRPRPRFKKTYRIQKIGFAIAIFRGFKEVNYSLISKLQKKITCQILAQILHK